jgi:hypothetical protein
MEKDSSKVQKQEFLKSEVIEKGYSQEIFVDFIANRKKSGHFNSLEHRQLDAH